MAREPSAPIGLPTAGSANNRSMSAPDPSPPDPNRRDDIDEDNDDSDHRSETHRTGEAKAAVNRQTDPPA
jgi:hypothetical protein